MARQINVTIPHELGQEEARRRIDQGFAKMRAQLVGAVGGMLRFQDRWEGNRLHFEGGGLGQVLSGRLDVLPDSVHIQLDLPEFLAALADRVAGNLKEQGQKLLEKR